MGSYFEHLKKIHFGNQLLNLDKFSSHIITHSYSKKCYTSCESTGDCNNSIKRCHCSKPEYINFYELSHIAPFLAAIKYCRNEFWHIAWRSFSFNFSSISACLSLSRSPPGTTNSLMYYLIKLAEKQKLVKEKDGGDGTIQRRVFEVLTNASWYEECRNILWKVIVLLPVVYRK